MIGKTNASGDTSKPEVSCSVTPTTSAQQILPDTGKVFNEVNVNAVTSAIDSNIQAENIKKDVEILGVTGTMEGIPQDASIIPSDLKKIISIYNRVKQDSATTDTVSKRTISNPIAIPCDYIYGIDFNTNSQIIDIPDGTYDLCISNQSTVFGNIKIETINNIRYLTIYSTVQNYLITKINTKEVILVFKICNSFIVDENLYFSGADKGLGIKIGDSFTTTSVRKQYVSEQVIYTVSSSIDVNVQDTVLEFTYTSNTIPLITLFKKQHLNMEE